MEVVQECLREDPITKSYPELTPYQFASNTPIWAIDLDGLEKSNPGEKYKNGVTGVALDNAGLFSDPNIDKPISDDAPPAPKPELQFVFNPTLAPPPTMGQQPAPNNVSTAVGYVDMFTMPIQSKVGGLAAKGSNLGSNLTVYNPRASGRVFNGNQHVDVIKFKTINVGLKIGGNVLLGVSVLGDMADYNSGAIGKTTLGFNLSSSAVGIANPAVGVGLLLFNNTSAGKEFGKFLNSFDQTYDAPKNTVPGPLQQTFVGPPAPGTN